MSDAEQHKAEMKKLQAEQRAKVAEATDPDGGSLVPIGDTNRVSNKS